MSVPFHASVYWDLPVLLVTFSLVYSATRHDRWDRILWEAAGWIVRVGGFLLMVGVGLYIASSYPDYWRLMVVLGGIGSLIYFGGPRLMQAMAKRKAANTPGK